MRVAPYLPQLPNNGRRLLQGMMPPDRLQQALVGGAVAVVWRQPGGRHGAARMRQRGAVHP